MVKGASNLNERIAARIRELRGSQRLSLDALAVKSGVSRSMLSLIERGESSATAVVLEKIAAALSVTLASLFDAPTGAKGNRDEAIARRKDQPQWRDPGSGYVRRNISPADANQPLHVIEVHFPSRGRVAFEGGARHARVYQQIWLLKGAMNISYGEETYRLREGDCVALQLDRPMMFHNPTAKTAHYVVINVTEPTSRR